MQDQIKGKTWRSLDLAGNQSNSLFHTVNTNTNVNSAHHNPLTNNPTVVAPSHYQRHDFKNRRSSSEPANEQKLLLAHIQHSHMHAQAGGVDHSHTKTSNQTTSTHIDEHSQVEHSATTVAAATTERDEFIDIDCPHQKPIKVSEQMTWMKKSKFGYSFFVLLNISDYVSFVTFFTFSL